MAIPSTKPLNQFLTHAARDFCEEVNKVTYGLFESALTMGRGHEGLRRSSTCPELSTLDGRSSSAGEDRSLRHIGLGRAKLPRGEWDILDAFTE